jgi:two-component system, cell cycle sensor histidine kinase and response regulator CckA
MNDGEYRSLIENAVQGIFRVTLEGQFLMLNPALARILGYDSPRDAMDRVTDIASQVYADPLQRQELMARLLREERILDAETVLKKRGGERVTVILNLLLVRDGEGKPAHVEGSCIDVTDRRQTEEKYQKVFMMSPDCIAITRITDGRIIEVNQGFEDITGWKRNDVIGLTSLEIDFWAEPSDRGMMTRDLGSGRDIMNREFHFRRRDGTVRTGLYSARTMRIADEACLIFLLHDVTERRRLEEERRTLEQQLFQSQKMDAIGQLAGGVAHDFNNMLSVIIGNTEMALELEDPAQPLHNALQEIMHAAERSADLTRQLLAFARKQKVNPRVIDLNDKVAGILKMLQRLIGENISLAWIPGKDLWSVRMDPSQVDQLLANLTVNARDAMNRAGKIVIETSNTACDEAHRSIHPEWNAGDFVLLTVSDDGCGMDREVLSNIFQPFFTTKKEGHGTGLGLATVYGIVKQNGGFINVYSEPGLGTTFRIYLPRCRGEEPAEVGNGGKARMPGGTETILIVEDENAVLELSKGMLEKLGYRVIAVREPDQAIRLAVELGERIDMLLTDVVMPDMNGRELSERIRAIRPGLPCLYMSGYTADVIARQGILDEGLHFMSKPFSLINLAVKVRETLGTGQKAPPSR